MRTSCTGMARYKQPFVTFASSRVLTLETLAEHVRASLRGKIAAGMLLLCKSLLQFRNGGNIARIRERVPAVDEEPHAGHGVAEVAWGVVVDLVFLRVRTTGPPWYTDCCMYSPIQRRKRLLRSLPWTTWRIPKNYPETGVERISPPWTYRQIVHYGTTVSKSVDDTIEKANSP